MTIRTAHNAFFNLAFGLCDALGKGDIERFGAISMVEIESAGVYKTTINTACRGLAPTKPITNRLSSYSRSLSIAWTSLLFCPFVIATAILRIIWPISRPTITFLNLVGIAFTPTPHSLSLSLLFLFNVHMDIVACNIYPCKPDIFAMTYEEVSDV